MAGGIRPDPEQVIRAQVSRAQDIRQIGAATGDVLYNFGLIAAADYPQAPGVGTADFTQMIASALVAVALFIVLALMTFGVMLLSFIFAFLRLALSKVPLVGNGLKHLTDVTAFAVDPMITWIAGEADHALSNVLNGVVSLVHWAIRQPSNAVQDVSAAIVAAGVAPVKAEVDHLWAWVNHISNAVVTLQHELAAFPVTTAIGRVTIADQLHTAQNDIGRLWGAVSGIHTTLDQEAARINGLESNLDTLVRHVTGVRALNVGFQDIVSEISQLENAVKGLASDTLPRIDLNAQNIARLIPLAILADAGVEGIRNLRRLEDDICQCPRFPPGFNELGLAAALLHHVKGD